MNFSGQQRIEIQFASGWCLHGVTSHQPSCQAVDRLQSNNMNVCWDASELSCEAPRLDEPEQALDASTHGPMARLELWIAFYTHVGAKEALTHVAQISEQMQTELAQSVVHTAGLIDALIVVVAAEEDYVPDLAIERCDDLRSDARHSNISPKVGVVVAHLLAPVRGAVDHSLGAQEGGITGGRIGGPGDLISECS